MSKIADSWRRTPSSLTRATRSRTVRLVEPEPLAEHRVRPGLEREVPLDRVEQLAVEVLELVVARASSVMRSSVARRRRRAGNSPVDRPGIRPGRTASGAGSPASSVDRDVRVLARPLYVQRRAGRSGPAAAHRGHEVGVGRSTQRARRAHHHVAGLRARPSPPGCRRMTDGDRARRRRPVGRRRRTATPSQPWTTLPLAVELVAHVARDRRSAPRGRRADARRAW